jgi:hypothetical protein
MKAQTGKTTRKPTPTPLDLDTPVNMDSDPEEQYIDAIAQLKVVEALVGAQGAEVDPFTIDGVS